MKTTFAAVFAGATMLASSAFAGAFLQASSTETQLATDTKPKVVTMNSTDAAKDMTNENGVVTIPEDGTYFLMAAGQVGGTAAGDVKIWMKINDADVGNSNTIQAIGDPKFTAVLVCQGLATMKKGDKVTVAFSSTAPNVGLVVTSPPGEPVVPAVIFSAFKVD
jgi:hypothetical protein